MISGIRNALGIAILPNTKWQGLLQRLLSMAEVFALDG
jgi:hypothetical protein